LKSDSDSSNSIPRDFAFFQAFFTTQLSKLRSSSSRSGTPLPTQRKSRANSTVTLSVRERKAFDLSHDSLHAATFDESEDSMKLKIEAPQELLGSKERGSRDRLALRTFVVNSSFSSRTTFPATTTD